MSLFSKLFGGDKEAEETAKSLLKSIFGNQNESKPETKPEYEDEPEAASVNNASDDSDYEAPSGFSWGDKMPAEENQYNFNGTFKQYFENIFSTEFAAYRYEKAENYGRVAYTLYGAAGKAIVVELMPGKSESKKLRKQCEAEGTPYVRFYYNHEGWWNTKEYVIQRMKEKIRG